MTHSGIIIDPEFEALIPALASDEYDALEASLLDDGCRDALIVWRNGEDVTLVDGHNRYHLCQKHDLLFTTIEHAFDTREDVIVWMVRNQLARRNINAFVRTELVLKMTGLIDALKAKGKANQGNRGAELMTQSIDTRKQLANIAGVSPQTFHTVRHVIDNAPEYVKEKARSGEISIHRAEGMSDALKDAAPEVVEAVERYGVEDPQTIVLMTGLHDKDRDSWGEIRDSGYIQSSDETDAVSITAPSVLLYKAIEKKAETHRFIAGFWCILRNRVHRHRQCHQ